MCRADLDASPQAQTPRRGHQPGRLPVILPKPHELPSELDLERAEEPHGFGTADRLRQCGSGHSPQDLPEITPDLLEFSDTAS